MPKKLINDGLTDSQRTARAADPVCEAVSKDYPVVQGVYPVLVQTAVELLTSRKVGDVYQAVLEASNIMVACAEGQDELTTRLQTVVNACCDKHIAKIGRLVQMDSPLEQAVLASITKGQSGN